ncbi:hypothetical protein BESB_067030 [Besnoitia besnoiti]|uniref:ubiquitinyl hydrolase 1 n=1 Tax=Besnoitia besnoiti TaxID=94643 RepID=A0A2A9MGX0_BESBE|nr:hypothetical protein BESB_067030 [Besnoitia besnoiti]PFH34670.1 hypothetical protein BESB_067030 [Besnoitia besnoiti]
MAALQSAEEMAIPGSTYFGAFAETKPEEPTDEVLNELRTLLDHVRVSNCMDTVVKTQCTYSLDSPLSPCGLFVNLSTFLATSIDALPLDCLLRAANGASRSSTPSASAERCVRPSQRLYLHVCSKVDDEQAGKIHQKLAQASAKRPHDPGDDAQDSSARPPNGTENASAADQTDAPQPHKLAINVEGGFQIEENSGDACPSALSNTFVYSLVLLPPVLTLPANPYRASYLCAPASSSQDAEAAFHSHQLAQIAWERSLLKQLKFVQLSDKLPEMIRAACQALIEHRSTGAAASSAGLGAWEEEIKASKYASNLQQVADAPRVGPTDWRCADCGATANLWLNLSDGYIGCGRKLYGIGGGCADGREGAAIRHFEDTGKKYPLIVKLGTITPYSADVYSYAADEDSTVLDPHLPEHLAHFGINVQQLTKTEKSTNELALDWNVQHEWSRAMEADRELLPCNGAGCVGLRNLGNTCYINAVLQAVTSLPLFREKYVTLLPALFASLAPASAGSHAVASDFLLKQSALAAALQTPRYRLQHARRREAILHKIAQARRLAAETRTEAGEEVTPEMLHECEKQIAANASAAQCLAYLETDSVTPQLYRQLVGTLHAEFATSHQQDAEEFFSLLLQWLEERDREAKSRVREARQRLAASQGEGGNAEKELLLAAAFDEADATLAESALNKGKIEKLFTFAVEQRIECAETKQVRYSYTRQQILALPVPVDPAIQERFEQTQLEHEEAERRLKKRQKKAEEDGPGTDKDLEGRSSPDSTTTVSSENGVGGGFSPGGDEASCPPPPAQLPAFTLNECLESFLASTVLKDFYSSATGKRGEASKQLRLASFPPYLVVQLKRFFADKNWQAKKLYCPVLVPEEVNIAESRGSGLKAGEVLLPEEEDGGSRRPSAGGGAGAVTAFDEELLTTLQSMGFSENASKRACVAAQSSSPDACIDWLMSHMDDADLNDPLPSSSPSSSEADEAVAMICGMGFTVEQAKAGLLAVGSGGDVCGRAADWLLNHMDDLESAVRTVLAEAEQKNAKQEEDAEEEDSEPLDALSPFERARRGLDDNPQGRYKLHAFITHMGKNANSGHYVCHVKRGGKLVLFNDEKVAEAVEPPVDLGYIYVFRRSDIPGDEA